MIIAQISDTHIALDAPDSDTRTKNLFDTIADIKSLTPAPDVIVHTGDIAHWGRPEEYDVAAAALASAPCPVYVLVGNRDDRANLRKAFFRPGSLPDASEFIQYAIDAHPVRLVMLDTRSANGNKGDFCRERFLSLSALLAGGAAKPVAVFMHHPPFEVPAAPEPLHFESTNTYDEVRQALQQSAPISAIFTGHVHRASFGDVGGIPGTAMPATATSLRKGKYPEPMQSRPVYLLHRFDPRWGFSTETRIVGEAPSSS